MADVVETVLENAGEQIVRASPLKRLGGLLVKIFLFFITLKVVLEILILLGKGFIKWVDMIRQSILISLSKKHLEENVWKVIWWIKTWRYIYGIIIGLVLAYYLQVDDHVMKFIEYVIDVFS